MLNRKDKTIIAAIELLEEVGVSGITTKKLAAKQNVSEPALYRQFKSKQDILHHIIEEYSSYDRQIEQTIIESDIHGKEAILFYVDRYGQLYQNYSELTTVMFSMDLYFYNETTRAIMESICKQRLLFLEQMIDENKGEIKGQEKFTSSELAGLIDGVIFSQVYQWRMAGKSYQLDERLLDMVTRLL